MNNQHPRHPVFVWDTYAITAYQAQYLLENGEARDEGEAFNLACADTDLLDGEWELLTDTLSHWLNEIHPGGQWWQAEMRHFGWRGQDGWKKFRARDGREFLREILPNTDCTFKVFIDPCKAVRIQNFHHDSPVGNEWYYITPYADEIAMEEAA